MRLLTKEQRLAYRRSMIPANAFPDPRNGDHGEAYYYDGQGRFYAIAFIGASGRPTFHNSFRNDSQRANAVYRFFESLKAHAKFRDERKITRSQPHDVKVGDIFRALWGYDQTNIDYYEVLELIGSTMALVQEIQQETEETAYLQGECVPRPGVPATVADYSAEGEAYKATHGCYPRKAKSPFRVRIQGGKSPAFKATECSTAFRITPVSVIGGKPIYNSSHWTAYA